jgi:hypothetical protein
MSEDFFWRIKGFAQNKKKINGKRSKNPHFHPGESEAIAGKKCSFADCPIDNLWQFLRG